MYFIFCIHYNYFGSCYPINLETLNSFHLVVGCLLPSLAISFLIIYCHPTSVLVVALEKVERSSGPLIGSSIASIQKSTAPEVDFITCRTYSNGIVIKYSLSSKNAFIVADATCADG